MMTTIYCHKRLFDYLIGIFNRNGKPLPANYVTATKKFSNKYIYHARNSSIHGKDSLKHLAGEYFFPETYFSGEKVKSKKENPLFFLKEIERDNGTGIKLLKFDDIPTIVPPKHILQPEIESTLYNQRKFDIRVLVCVKRTGKIMIYKNLTYQINPKIFSEQTKDNIDISYYITNRMFHGEKSLNFFEKNTPGEFDVKNYLDQLKLIIPRIYAKLLPISNTEYHDELDSSFIFGGLDFIQSKKDNNLMFLEMNVTPGWARQLGIGNYQNFYQLATDFILGRDENTDECLYVSI